MIKKANPGDNRDRELNKLAITRTRLIRDAKRIFLRKLIQNGSQPVEAIHSELDIPAGIDKRFLGCVAMDLARGHIIRKTGFMTKQQPDSHGSPVGVWELSDFAKANELIKQIEIQQKSESAATDSLSDSKKGVI